MADLKSAEAKMQGAIDVMVNEFKGVRTGRANPALVENVKVEYYGTPTPLKQVASVTTPDPRTIMIKAFDNTVLGAIDKAIQAENLGLTPHNDGKIIRISIPPSPRTGASSSPSTSKNKAKPPRFTSATCAAIRKS